MKIKEFIQEEIEKRVIHFITFKVRSISDQIKYEQQGNPEIYCREICKLFLSRLRVSAIMISAITGSAFYTNKLELSLLREIASFYYLDLTEEEGKKILPELKLKPLEQINLASEISFFIPALGNLIKAAIGERVISAIGQSIIAYFEKTLPNALWRGI